METNEETLNAFELDRAELAVTQQLLKIALNHIVQGSSNPREARDAIAAQADELLKGYEIQGFGQEKAAVIREHMLHHATTLPSEIGYPV